MKAITLWQPWATLWVMQIKKFETRSWKTDYRGPIAIHAAAKSIYREVFPCSDYEYHPSYKAKKQFCDAIKACELDEDAFPKGCVIATAELINCHKIVLHGGRGMASTDPGWLETENGIYCPDETELLFGNWSKGRYAWEVANVRVLAEPVPAKGSQRLWEWGGAA